MSLSHSQNSGFEVTQLSENTESLINAVSLNDDLKYRLLNTPIIIYPQLGFRDSDKPLFPQGTEGIYHYLQSNLPKNISIELCIEDKDYCELTLHADWARLGIFVVTSIALPIFLGVISSYIYDKITSESENNNISLSIIVTETQDSVSKKIYYEGPAKDFSNISKEIEKIMEPSSERKPNQIISNK